MTPDSEGLHEIANTTKTDRKADIVFIHGLGGTSYGTWRHGKEGKQGHFFWPEELGKDLPDCGIWSVGYPAGFTELGKPGMIIEKRAGNVSHKLATAGLGDRPLFFVTHSMGGLIVKSLIVESQTLADVDRKRIVSIVRGIVFCGTPHRGSEFADMAGVLGKYSSGILGALFRGLFGSFLGGFLGDFFGARQAHVDEMRANAEPLDILHDKFIEWHRNHPIPVESYAENIGLFRKRWFLRPLPLGPVVPRASANPGIAGHTVHDVDDDHLTLVKPPNRQHDVYAGVLRLIRDALKLIPNDGAPSIVTIEFRSEEPVNEFDPVKLETGFEEALGIKASRIRILSVRPGSTIVTLETDPATRQEIVTALSLYQQAHREFTRLTGMTKMSCVVDGVRRTLDLSQDFVSPERKCSDQGARDDWYLAHPYPMPPNFTGRVAERAMLTDWLNADSAHPLLVLRALGGFGKSALAWHWLMHDVTPAVWPRVVWWSFYEGDASFDNFLEKTVDYLKAGNPAQLGPRQRLDVLLRTLHQPGTLLILDGFERALRAYGGLNAAYQGDEARASANDRDCLSPHVEVFLRSLATLPEMRGKVLLTTRLRPAPVETRGGILLQGCREEELIQLQPADAVEFFRAQGIRGTHTEIEEACAPYGYHPLSLRLLAGLIVNDLQQPGDISAARRLDVSGDLVAHQHHVLEQAYNTLSLLRQKLLSRIACFRGPVSYDAIKAVAEQAIDADLRDLVARGLLHHDRKENRFDLHPIVRRYAYDRLTASDRAAAHTRLRDYFAAVPEPDKVMRLEDLAPVIELYHHTVRAGQFDEAFTLFSDRLHDAAYYQLGAYQLIIDLLRTLFPDGEDRPPRLKDESAQGWTLNSLANSYSLSGQPRRAVPLFEQQNASQERLGSKKNLAIGLGNVADDQLKIGALRAAEADLRRRIALCREIKDEFNEAIGHQELGRLLAYRGAYAESEADLEAALRIKVWRENPQGHGVNRAYRALRELLRLRSPVHSRVTTHQSPLQAAGRALELADETARTIHPGEHDYVRAHWLLGAAHRVAGQTDEAERHLDEALERCRRINNVEHEADILIDLARLRAATNATDEAKRLAEEALLITERSGYVLQGADAHLELAKLALGRGDKAAAKEHAQKAKEFATCDGPPDYTYKVAYDEAGALLATLGK